MKSWKWFLYNIYFEGRASVYIHLTEFLDKLEHLPVVLVMCLLEAKSKPLAASQGVRHCSCAIENTSVHIYVYVCICIQTIICILYTLYIYIIVIL